LFPKLETNDMNEVANTILPYFEKYHLLEVPEIGYSVDHSFMVHSFQNWKKYKQVYRINKEFSKILPRSNTIKISSINLPFSNFFIEMGTDLDFELGTPVGALIELSKSERNNKFENYLSIIILRDNERETSLYTFYDENSTFDDIFDIDRDYDNRYKEAEAKKDRILIKEYAYTIISVLCYLSMEKPDISKPTKKKVDKVIKGKKVKLVNIKESAVGDRYIKYYKKTKKDVSAETNRKSVYGYKQPPVFRSGHFKSVRYGKGKKKSKIVWVDGYRTHKEITGDFKTIREVNKK